MCWLVVVEARSLPSSGLMVAGNLQLAELNIEPADEGLKKVLVVFHEL